MADGLKLTLKGRALPPGTELGPLKTKALELDDDQESVQFETPSPGYKGSWQETGAEAGTLVSVPKDTEHDVDALFWACDGSGDANSRRAIIQNIL